MISIIIAMALRDRYAIALQKNCTIMLDWLAAWGVSTAVGFVFKDVIAPLAKGALEDYVKDFFKDSIKDFTGLLAKDTVI